MNKVLMIARVFPPFNPVGHSIRAVKFIKYLPMFGWMPVVLTIDDQKEYENAYKLGSDALLLEINPKVKIYRTKPGVPSVNFLEKEKKFGQRNRLTALIVRILGGSRRWVFRNFFLPDRDVAWLPFALRRGHQILKRENIDVIFATCPPHSVILLGTCLKLITGKPLVLDFRDDWIGTPWYNSKSTVVRFIERRLESWAIKTANKVILVTEYSKKAFQDRYPKQPGHKFIFISNGCDLGDFADLTSIPQTPLNSKFTILHAGSLNVSKSWGRNPAGLLQAIQLILQKRPDLSEKLNLVFAGDFPNLYHSLANEMGLSFIIEDLGHIPHDKVLRLIKSADLLIAINFDGWPTLIPGKIYEYWAVGGPPILLLSCNGAAKEFIEQNGLGVAVSPEDASAIERGIMTVYNRRELGFPWKIDTLGIEKYDRKVLSERLAQIFSGLLSYKS